MKCLKAEFNFCLFWLSNNKTGHASQESAFKEEKQNPSAGLWHNFNSNWKDLGLVVRTAAPRDLLDKQLDQTQQRAVIATLLH